MSMHSHHGREALHRPPVRCVLLLLYIFYEDNIYKLLLFILLLFIIYIFLFLYYIYLILLIILLIYYINNIYKINI